MDKDKSDWIESLKQIPGFVRGVILFITGIAGFILFFRENVYLNIVVTVFSSALAGIAVCIYVLFKKSRPLIEGGRGVYVYDKYRAWAMGGIVVLTGGFVFSIFQPETAAYIEQAFPDADNSTDQALSSAPMVKIEGGKFIRGSNDLQDALPEKAISLQTFWIDVYEVTNEAYSKFVEQKNHLPPEHWAGGTYPSGKDTHPVAGVTWQDAERYCEFVNKRLPTEAEWEKAARGVNGSIWPWGNEWDPSKANVRETGVGDTMPVGSYPQGNSDFGVADMAGNVKEWVADWYQEDYYDFAPAMDPPGPGGQPVNEHKVIRGGAWYDEKENVRTFARLGIYPPDYPFRTNQVLPVPLDYLGFRCACSDCQ